MNKKSILILLSILHICILGVCILTIYNNKHSRVTVVYVSFDTKTAVMPKEILEEPETDTKTEEPEQAVEPEADTEPTEEAEPEQEPEIETSTETAEEIQANEPTENTVLYSFHYVGTKNKLNIRSAPSMEAKIISKVPVGGSGSVLELTDENWVRIECDGIVGYCSRKWIELQEITE